VNRSTLSVFGVTAALAAITGVAVLTGAGGPAAGPTATARRLPVERTTLTCPAPSDSDLASTQYTSYTPKGTASSGSGGSAELLPTAQADSKTKPGTKPVAPLRVPGQPVTATNDNANAPALVGTADGALAPGWTVQQTTVIDAGPQRGVLGASCTAPDSDFWFPGVSTSSSRQDYVHLTNPDDTAAVIDLQLYDTNGSLDTETGNGITVPPDSTVSVLLSTLTTERTDALSLHVTARTGRVGAEVEDTDRNAGGDWLQAAADPATTLVMPGIPADATDVRLVTYATGDDDADLGLRLLTPSGPITPAGHETVHVKSGMTTSVDLGALTQGEVGSLVLSPSDPSGAAPVVAALRITRGKGSDQETAFIPATAPVEDQATVADNRAKGSTLSLAAVGGSATARVTTSDGTTKTVTIKPGTTVPVQLTGKGTYAAIIQKVSGGALYASRELALPQDGVPMFTIQTLPDDKATVAVPTTSEDLSILNRPLGRSRTMPAVRGGVPTPPRTAGRRSRGTAPVARPPAPRRRRAPAARARPGSSPGSPPAAGTPRSGSGRPRARRSAAPAAPRRPPGRHRDRGRPPAREPPARRTPRPSAAASAVPGGRPRPARGRRRPPRG
jgi:hypothetical protein